MFQQNLTEVVCRGVWCYLQLSTRYYRSRFKDKHVYASPIFVFKSVPKPVVRACQFLPKNYVRLTFKDEASRDNVLVKGISVRGFHLNISRDRFIQIFLKLNRAFVLSVSSARRRPRR